MGAYFEPNVENPEYLNEITLKIKIEQNDINNEIYFLT